MSSGERTEAATPRRLKELRDKGRLVRSGDLVMAGGLMAGFVVLQSFGGNAAAELRGEMEQQFSTLMRPEFTDASLADLWLSTGMLFFRLLAPLVALLVVAVVLNVGQTGLALNGRGLTPQFSRLNPWAALQRLFSLHGVVELAKTLLKAALVAFVLYHVYTESVMDLAALALGDLRTTAPQLAALAMRLGFTAAAALLGLGILDYGYQRWDFIRSSRMTKDELREEFKQTEGDPKIKQRIRQLQRKLASRRMMKEVPKADVVVTNPTHFAVALAYRPGEMVAPRVVAKGADALAQRIKEIAREHDVPVVENKPLARALYASVEIDQEIPVELFQAVAEVLAYIYALRGNGAGQRAN
jgi:flagellar biosynthetic protein FlhB